MDTYPRSCPKLKAGQERLTPKQEAYAHQLAQERQAALRSCEPIDERKAEDYVCHIYRVANLQAPPIRWCSSPIEFVQNILLQVQEEQKEQKAFDRDALLNDGWARVFAEGGDDVWGDSNTAPQATHRGMVFTRHKVQPGVWNQSWNIFKGRFHLRESMEWVSEQMKETVGDLARDYGYEERRSDGIVDDQSVFLERLGRYSVAAYEREGELACAHFSPRFSGTMI